MRKSEEAAAASQKAMTAKTDAESELYQGIQSTLTVSADKMNMLYRGIQNPISITVSGVKSENLIVSINNGTIKKVSNGKYEVLPGESMELVILVKGKTSTGKLIDFGSKSYRVKNIPDPIAKINGRSQGKILKTSLINTPGIAVDLPDFAFELKYIVISYSYISTVEGHSIVIDVQGNLFTAPLISYLKSLDIGSKILFTNIKAKGPDGKTRNLMPIILEIFEWVFLNRFFYL